MQCCQQCCLYLGLSVSFPLDLPIPGSLGFLEVLELLLCLLDELCPLLLFFSLLGEECDRRGLSGVAAKAVSKLAGVTCEERGMFAPAVSELERESDEHRLAVSVV